MSDSTEDWIEEREIEQIDFEIGDHVFYPHHGAGQVLKKEDHIIDGEVREYLTIKILHDDMTVIVPCENAGKAGLRRIMDAETVKKVLGVLSDDISEMPKNWNRRFKHNRDKIKTGDIYELAEVVRNLAVRERDKGLSTGEKQAYTKAKKILSSEMMYALEQTEEEAEGYLDEVLSRSSKPESALQVSGKGAEYTIERPMDREEHKPPVVAPSETSAAAQPAGREPARAPAAGTASSGSSSVRRETTAYDETAERFWTLLARSEELGRNIDENLASLTLVGRHSLRSDELSLAVKRHAGAIERRAETKSALAQRLRERGASLP